MLLEGEVVLPGSLGGDGDQQSAPFADLSVQVAPGLELGDAVWIPTAAKEVDDQRAEGEQVGGADWFVGESVFEDEGRGLGADLQDAVFDTGIEEVCSRFFRDGETLRLDERAGVGGYGVELVLQ